MSAYKQSIRLPASLVPKAKECIGVYTECAKECDRITAEAQAKIAQLHQSANERATQLWYEIVEAMGYPNADYRNSEWFIDTSYSDFGIAFLNQRVILTQGGEYQLPGEDLLKEIAKEKVSSGSKLN